MRSPDAGDGLPVPREGGPAHGAQLPLRVRDQWRHSGTGSFQIVFVSQAAPCTCMRFDASSPTLQGRFSFVGAQPALEVIAKGTTVEVHDHTQREGGASTSQSDDPLEVPIRLSRGWRPVADPGLPRVFTGGWVGYCGYDTVRYVYSGERMLLSHCVADCLLQWLSTRAAVCMAASAGLPPNQPSRPCPPGKLPFDAAPADDRGLPDMHLARYDDVVVFDHATKLAYVIAWVHLDAYGSVEEAFLAGRRRLERLTRKLSSVPALPQRQGVDMDGGNGVWPPVPRRACRVLLCALGMRPPSHPTAPLALRGAGVAVAVAAAGAPGALQHEPRRVPGGGGGDQGAHPGWRHLPAGV